MSTGLAPIPQAPARQEDSLLLLQIRAFLEQTHGTAYTADEVAQAFNASVAETLAVLDALAHDGIIERQQSIAGLTTFVVPRYARYGSAYS